MNQLKIIARIRSDFPEKFGIPRQSGVVPETRAKIVFEPEYRNEAALRGIEGFSHLWLIWGFSECERDSWSPTVRPPRLGGNTRMGVFATRSPFRPNPIGLSSVTLVGVEAHTPEGTVLVVGGAALIARVYLESDDLVLRIRDHGAESFHLTVRGSLHVDRRTEKEARITPDSLHALRVLHYAVRELHHDGVIVSLREILVADFL